MIEIQGKEFVPFINAEEIDNRLQAIGAQISLDFKDETPVIIGVLNGAFMFLSDLIKYLNIATEISFIKVASYSGTDSTGKVTDLIGLESELEGRRVIIVEDIIDTGLSMTHLIKSIQTKNPKSIAVATLLFKPEALKYSVDIDYIGFKIENKFVVGYGLDYDGLGRNIPSIYQLK
ncbi:hypoxanthine phosphoribosyltransferase [Belliella aquatica]|uniref:Hypoxanthine phosphoribosyltransferase n=1 Tax=Belliella aquatica TaxID=1323734 RepID=A0ABQ1MRU8_9BACT|nr:hypoxanthine phosphoribosyltransferase [Belliella aquatica]MCH7406045.1 hypoxanthine phosphoribosyltransferase [Belliella aquatica]GGC43146.1 hypoxanthine phosphoribosyltransferase [Belliella aquatica]